MKIESLYTTVLEVSLTFLVSRNTFNWHKERNGLAVTVLMTTANSTKVYRFTSAPNIAFKRTSLGSVMTQMERKNKST